MIVTVRGLTNLVIRLYRRYRWHLHPARLWPEALNGIPIDRPIFLLGVQGGGLTLLARMLRRHSRTVSVTGSHEYWAGPDEMQNVMGSFLPQSLAGLHYKIPSHPTYIHRDNIYAIDDLLTLYRKTRQDATPEIGQRFRQAIRLAIRINTRNSRAARFVDKSQTYTIRLGFMNALLREYDPRFISVWRNPYAHCYRSATRAHSLLATDESLRTRLALAAQHWSNSFRCALKDAGEVDYFLELRFEDLLREPRAHLKEICDFVELDFQEDMLPHENDEFPLGSTGSSKGDHKWYPLRPDVNRRHLEALQPWMIRVIDEQIGQLAERRDYSPDGP